MRRFSFSYVVVGILAGAVFAAAGLQQDTRAVDDPALVRISNVRVSALNATSAMITWITDKKTDGTLNFSLDPNYGIARQTGPLTNTHSITISDLDPSTTYFFRVFSADVSANQTVSEGHSFTTKGLQNILTEDIENEEDKELLQKALEIVRQIKDPEALALLMREINKIADDLVRPPAIIGTPIVIMGESDSTIIRWITDRPANSIVEVVRDDEYDPEAEDPYPIKQGNFEELVTEHEVELIGLEAATKYHYRVVSKPEVGSAGRSTDRTFTTKATLPTISGVTVRKVEENSATLAWNTNIPTNGIVEYTNTRTRQTKSAGDPTFLTNHVVQLTDLEFDTTYSAIVKGENEMGDKVQSDPVRFTTVRDDAPPAISKVNNESTLYPGEDTKIQTIITWQTDEPSYCQFFYNEGISVADAKSMLAEENPVTDHVQVITSLTPSTVYKFWLECLDRSDNKSRSEDFVLFTPEKEKSIIDIILDNFQGSFGWVKKVGK